MRIAAVRLPDATISDNMTSVSSLPVPGMADSLPVNHSLLDTVSVPTAADAWDAVASGSLASLEPSAAWPVVVASVPGMGYVADAGYSAVVAVYGTAATPLQTPFAQGNASGAGGFTCEIIRGTGAVFGPVAAADAVPLARSWQLPNYACATVSASQPAAANQVSADAAPAAQPAVEPGNGSASNPDSVTDALRASTTRRTRAYRLMGQPPLPGELPWGAVASGVRYPVDPRARLKATLGRIRDNLTGGLTADQINSFRSGFADGFAAGARNTLEFIESLQDVPGNIAMTIYEGYDWTTRALGDAFGSLIFWTPAVEYKAGVEAARNLSRQIGNAAITAENATVVAGDLLCMTTELQGLIGARIVERVFGGKTPPNPGNGAIVDRVLDQASPLTIAVLNVVADAVADLSPRDAGYILGLVAEQIVECVVAAAATAGAAELSEVGMIGRIVDALDGTEAIANSERLQAVVQALRRAETGGGDAEKIGNEVREAYWELRNWNRGLEIEKDLAKTEYKGWKHIGKINNGFQETFDFEKGRTMVSVKTTAVDPNNEAAFNRFISRMKRHITDPERGMMLKWETEEGEAAVKILDIRVPTEELKAKIEASGLKAFAEQYRVVVQVKIYP